MSLATKRKVQKVEVEDVRLLITQAQSLLGGMLKLLKPAGAVSATMTAATRGRRFDKGCPPPNIDLVKRFDKGCPPPLRMESVKARGGGAAAKNVGKGVAKRLRNARVLLDAAQQIIPLVQKWEKERAKTNPDGKKRRKGTRKVWSPSNPTNPTP